MIVSRQPAGLADDSPSLAALSNVEHDILRQIVAGRSNPEIAAEFFISVNTVKFHVANILRKLEVRSRLDAAVLFTAAGSGGSE